MGAIRFTLGAIYEILTQRSHRCRMAYLPASQATVDAARQVGSQTDLLQGPPSMAVDAVTSVP